MNDLLFKFTLSNTTAGDLVISEPGGWDKAVLKLERNKDYHSLVEYYNQPLMFYGVNMLENGGIDYIRDIENTQGPDAQITLTIEISHDGGYSYELCFTGQLDIESAMEIDGYKLEMGIIRDDFWSKLINRKGIPVDLESVTDLDGDSRTAVPGFTLSLPSQKLLSRYQGHNSDGVILNQDELAVNEYVQFDMTLDTIDEIKQKFSIGTAGNPSLPVSLFNIDYRGSYAFDIRIEMSSKGESGGGLPGCPGTIVTDPTNGVTSSTEIHLFIKINNDTPVQLTETNVTGLATIYTYTGTHELQVGDQVRLYGFVDALGTSAQSWLNLIVWGTNNTLPAYRGDFSYNGSICVLDSVSLVTTTYGSAPSGVAVPTYINIDGQTLYDDTETEAYLLGDAIESIISRITGSDNVVLSDYLTTGCGKDYAIMKGLHVRGYSFADKPFTMSFDQWWNGAAKILNLGMGYELFGSPEVSKIRIEQQAYFFDASMSVLLNWVDGIERSYSKELIFKSVELGYEKWSAESASGIDDPQTKRTYSTRFKTIGKDLKILSSFVAASLAIEQTRRNRVEQGKDWRMDDDIMIIAINQGISPVQPELNENFDLITGLLNSDTRYNIRLSVARNFERWKSYFNGCLQWYLGTDAYKFASGEGNYDMTTQLAVTDCEAGDIPPESSPGVSLDSLSSAVNKGSGTSWTIDADPSVSLTIGATSKYLSIPLNNADAETVYSFTVNMTYTINPWAKRACLLNAAGTRISPRKNLVSGDNSFTLEATETPFYLGIEMVATLASTITINSATVSASSTADILDEGGDIDVTDDYIMKPIEINVTHYLTWQEYKTIRDNPKKAIGISSTDTNHLPYFIDILEYNINTGETSMKLNPARTTDQIMLPGSGVYTLNGWAPMVSGTVLYVVTVNAKNGDSSASSGDIYYRIDGGTWTYLNTVSSTACTEYGTVNVPTGSTIEFTIRDADIGVSFNAQVSASCPSNTEVYCEYGVVYEEVITGATEISITAFVSGSVYAAC